MRPSSDPSGTHRAFSVVRPRRASNSTGTIPEDAVKRDGAVHSQAAGDTGGAGSQANNTAVDATGMQREKRTAMFSDMSPCQV
jgi:hypothetical protein